MIPWIIYCKPHGTTSQYCSTRYTTTKCWEQMLRKLVSAQGVKSKQHMLWLYICPACMQSKTGKLSISFPCLLVHVRCQVLGHHPAIIDCIPVPGVLDFVAGTALNGSTDEWNSTDIFCSATCFWLVHVHLQELPAGIHPRFMICSSTNTWPKHHKYGDFVTGDIVPWGHHVRGTSCTYIQKAQTQVEC
jgi:hypothetical protein